MSEEELKANFSENPNAADFRPQDLQLVMVPFVDMLNHQGGQVPHGIVFNSCSRVKAPRSQDSVICLQAIALEL